MKTLIWDFNGTIVDDCLVGVNIMNQLYLNHSIEAEMTLSKYQDIFTFPIYDYYVAAGLDFSNYSFEDTAKEYMALYDCMFDTVKVKNGFIEVIEIFRQKGYHNVIISAARQEDLIKQVKSLGIDGYFDEIIGIADILASSKVETALEWKRNTKFANCDMIFIGDTIHDLEVANAIGASCILVADGHQSKERLSKAHNIVIDRTSEVITCIE